MAAFLGQITFTAISTKKNHSKDIHSADGHRVLFTLQGPIGTHTQPIPDFIIDHLVSDKAQNDYFIFRGHPNYPQSMSYCLERLQAVSPKRYCISEGRENLYNEFLECTHHITAFSSCCYEAEMFNVPTLLFGTDAQSTYSDEIASGRFRWTSGHLDELNNWLAQPLVVNAGFDNQYIESSLTLASSQLDAIRRNNQPK